MSFSFVLLTVVLLVVFRTTTTKIKNEVDKGINHLSTETEIVYGSRRKELSKQLDNYISEDEFNNVFKNRG